MVCIIGKSAPKQLQFQKLVPFPPRESVHSIFHTNLYGARNSHNITALSAPKYVTRVSAYHSRETLVSEDLYQTSFLQLPFCFGLFWAVSRSFTDTKCWISLCLLIMKVYRGQQIHERMLFSYLLVWHAPSSIVVLAE